MSHKWTDPRPSRIGNTDLRKTNQRKPRIRQGRTLLRVDLRDWLGAKGWR